MIKTLLTAATLAAVIIATTAVVAGARAASERRAEYIDTESAYFECIESGLSRADCLAAVGW